MKYESRSIEETKKIATDFVAGLSLKKDTATVVGLYGNLGAGKTAFTQCVAKALGVGEKVLSPTFVIMKIYELNPRSLLGYSQGESLGASFKHLVHIDAYRMDSSDELAHLGWHDLISDPHNLILIEWPERVADIMPEHIKINLQTLEDENSRSIDIIQ